MLADPATELGSRVFVDQAEVARVFDHRTAEVLKQRLRYMIGMECQRLVYLAAHIETEGLEGLQGCKPHKLVVVAEQDYMTAGRVEHKIAGGGMAQISRH